MKAPNEAPPMVTTSEGEGVPDMAACHGEPYQHCHHHKNATTNYIHR